MAEAPGSTVDPAVIDALLEVTASYAELLLAHALRRMSDEREAFLVRCCPNRLCCGNAGIPAVLQAYEPIADSYYNELVRLLAMRWDPAIVDLDTFVSLGITYVIKLPDQAISRPEWARDRWHTFMAPYVDLLPLSLRAAINAR